MTVVSLLLLLCPSAAFAWSPPAAASRRAVLQQASAAAAATSLLVASPRRALADLADLDMEAPAEPMGGGVAVQMLTAEEVKKKKKEMSTPASRLKELQAKGNLTDKEKKELRKLKAEEMCEMLGRGC